MIKNLKNILLTLIFKLNFNHYFIVRVLGGDFPMILGLTCIVTGFFIAFDLFNKWEQRLEKIRPFIDRYKKYIGMIAMFVGLWKFFGPDLTINPIGYITEGMAPAYGLEPQPFIGDLLPALFVFVGGISLFPAVFNFFVIKEEKKVQIMDKIQKYRLFLGMANLLFGVIHLFIPGNTFF